MRTGAHELMASLAISLVHRGGICREDEDGLARGAFATLGCQGLNKKEERRWKEENEER